MSENVEVTVTVPDPEPEPETEPVVVVVASDDEQESESQEEIQREIDTAVTLATLERDVSDIRAAILNTPSREEVAQMIAEANADTVAAAVAVAGSVAEDVSPNFEADEPPTTQRTHWLFRPLSEWRAK